MNETVREWLNKAETDYRVAERELAVEHESDYGPVCFHAQQCVEKLIKALLICHEVSPPRTHDLPGLSRLLQAVEPAWNWDDAELTDLTDAAVDDRYPGTVASREDAQQMLGICTRLRESLLKLVRPPA
jgi:HEPN domain-containing protein